MRRGQESSGSSRRKKCGLERGENISGEEVKPQTSQMHFSQIFGRAELRFSPLTSHSALESWLTLKCKDELLVWPRIMGTQESLFVSVK